MLIKSDNIRFLINCTKTFLCFLSSSKSIYLEDPLRYITETLNGENDFWRWRVERARAGAIRVEIDPFFSKQI